MLSVTSVGCISTNNTDRVRLSQVVINFTNNTMKFTLSRIIVERLGGVIGVDSKEGEGSCFWFRIPMQRKNT